MNLIIDSRENNLYNDIISRDLESFQINIQKKPLDIGDIYINTDSFKLLFERKTKQDILSSVKDGRYHEQKSRLLSLENTKICYILEGCYILDDDPIIQGVIMNTLYRDNIYILFTKNIEDTATLILSICIRLYKNPDCFVFKEIECPMKMKTKKIENIDQKTCFILQLSQIPTISTTIAKNIALKHNSMKDFIEKLNSIENKLEYLQTFDKIGLKKAEKILEYL